MVTPLVVLLLVTALLGVPVAFVVLGAPLIAILSSDETAFVRTAIQRIYAGLHQYPILAIPLFLLAGELLNHGKITERLVLFARVCVGHWRGGLAQVSNVSCVVFSGLSGSAIADATSIGSVLIPAMEKQGYSRRFAAAVIVAGAMLGPIIPPSIMMIIYAFVTNVSVGALFAAGFLPGLLMGAGLMVLTRLMAKRYGFPPSDRRATAAEFVTALRTSFFALMAPVVIIGGILAGVFTATEAAAAAVLYALVLGLFGTRELTPKLVLQSIITSGIASGAVLFIIGTAVVLAWLLTILQIPQQASALLFGVTDNKYVFLLLVNAFLFVVGCFLDAGPAILILGPILMPAIVQYGIDPIHFAMVVCVNLTLGLATPPFGLVLFATASVAKVPIGQLVRSFLPFLACHIVVLMLITYIPEITLFVPRLLGYL